MTADAQTGPDDIFAYVFDGKGGAKSATPLHENEGLQTGGEGAFTWLHLRRTHPEARRLLSEEGLHGFVIDALTAEETQPRCTVLGPGVILNLRGINLNPGAEPDDMISVRLWLERDRVIGVWFRPLQAVADLVSSIQRQEAPVSVGDFVARLALRLADRAEPMVANLNEQIDFLEEQMLEPGSKISRSNLSGLRRSAIVLRRYFVPQRDALTTLEIEDLSWLNDRDRHRIKEAAERVSRLGEDLDAIRDRTQIVHDQIMDHRAERMNRQMLILSVVAAVFLPLGLLTGLLGINVGGIPGTESPWAFTIVCAVLLAIGLALVWWFRKIGLFK